MRRSLSCEFSSLKIIPSTAAFCSQLQSPRPHGLTSKHGPPAEQQQQQKPLATASAAADDDADLRDEEQEESSCFVALCLEHVLENILSNLSYWFRLGPAARVCQQWSRVAARITADEGIDTILRTDLDEIDDEHLPKHLDLVPWLSKDGHRVPSITICSGIMFRKDFMPWFNEPEACIKKLTRLTSLELCCVRMAPKVLNSLAGALTVSHTRCCGVRGCAEVVCMQQQDCVRTLA